MNTDKWINWKNSSLYFNLDGRSFYWAFNCVFEKHRGVTSTRINKSLAKHLIKKLNEGAGALEKLPNISELK
ncbi:hypothetical protein A3715_10275 [Oleiphilus sp. HI0009]|nr:hypothetical protein A3715_10275 [Oleiphilus sp. HI0009]